MHPRLVERVGRSGLPVLGKVETAAVAALLALGLLGVSALVPLLGLLLVGVLGVSVVPFVVATRGRRTVTSVGRESARRAHGWTIRDLEQQPRQAGRPVLSTGDISARLAPVLQTWSDQQLCHAWRASYVRLGGSDPQLLVGVAWERQLYLDEIERRYPDGFERWMHAQPRAASDPARFLPPPPPGPTGP